MSARAKMSRRAEGPAVPWWADERSTAQSRAYVAAMADKAVDEARAILAETEPDLRWTTSIPGRSTFEAFDSALADALAAFVGEPCHCAGGMHWTPERGYFHCNGIVPEGC